MLNINLTMAIPCPWFRTEWIAEIYTHVDGAEIGICTVCSLVDKYIYIIITLAAQANDRPIDHPVHIKVKFDSLLTHQLSFALSLHFHSTWLGNLIPMMMHVDESYVKSASLWSSLITYSCSVTNNYIHIVTTRSRHPRHLRHGQIYLHVQFTPFSGLHLTHCAHLIAQFN